MLKVMRLDQAPDHRPVPVALSFFCLHQIRQGKQIALRPIRERQGGAAAPQPGKPVHAAQGGHHIHPHPSGFRVLASKVERMASPEVFKLKRRNGDGVGLKFGQCLAQPHQICGIRQNQEVGIPAKLGCAVEHARLSAHEQGADVMRAHRRKDFAYRVRDQGSLRGRDRFARASRFPSSAALV